MVLFLQRSIRARNNRWQLAMLRVLGMTSGLTLVGFGSVGLLPADAQRTAQFELDSAICNNEWSEAIDIISTLVGSENTSDRDRTALLNLRDRLTQYRAEDVTVANAEACDRTEPYKLEASNPRNEPIVESIGWDGAVAAAARSELSTGVVTQSVPFALPVEVVEMAGLTPASPVDLRQGMNVVSGQVGTGHQVYSFVAGLGDVLTANLNVTRVMIGTLYTSDDSQLFIFDKNGKLIATADDTEGQQSRISEFLIPKTDVYFAVVTTYNNDPILNRDDYLTGWKDNGGGRFDYTLTLSGVTPTSLLVRE